MFFSRPDIPEPYKALLTALAAEKPDRYFYNYQLKDSAVGQSLLAAPPEEQRAFVLAAIKWLDRRKGQAHDQGPWMVRAAMLGLLRRRLPLDHDDLGALLDWSLRQSNNYWRGIPQMIKAVEDHLQNHELTPALRERIAQLVKTIESEHSTSETRK